MHLNYSPFKIKKYTRILEIILIIIQSIGIRFFNGQGYLLSLFIIFLLRNVLVKVTSKDIRNLSLIIGYLILIKSVNASFDYQSLIFQIVLVLTAYLFLIQYNDGRILLTDFYESLRIIFYHAMIGYALWTVIPGAFAPITLAGIDYRSLIHLFYVADTNYSGVYRNNGICWEPGLLQLMLNLLLFFTIRNRGNHIFQLLIVLTIITTGSTAGFILLGLNYIFFIIKNTNTPKGIKKIFISLFFFVLCFSIVFNNISDKFNEENTSGLVRSRDFSIGVELIKEKPILGHGKFTSTYLISKPFVWNLEKQMFTKEYLKVSGDMSGGFTNGLLGLIAWFGIPAALCIFVLLYQNRFIENNFYEKIIFFLILIISCYTEPITFTSFFLLFPFSTLILKKNHSNKI